MSDRYFCLNCTAISHQKECETCGLMGCSVYTNDHGVDYIHVDHLAGYYQNVDGEIEPVVEITLEDMLGNKMTIHPEES